jgi:ubiquinone/menaquinone biosynthesis C-methylase UbiE
MDKQMSGLGFQFVSLGFKLRDLFKPRGKVLQEAGIKPDAQVLDFGCGPGGYILPLSRMIGPYGKIYALDINPQAIRSVKSIASREKLNNIETIISDGKTGLPDMSMDFVLLYDVLHHLSQPEETLVELHRVLKPEGILAMSDHHMEDDEITRTITAPGTFKLLRRGDLAFYFTRVE